MKKISFDIYWIQNEINTELIRNNILKKHFLFEPFEMVLEDETLFEDGIGDLIDANLFAEDKFSLHITGKREGFTADLIMVINKFGDQRYIRVSFTVPLKENGELVFYEKYLEIEGLLCCFVNDYEDELWQSTTSIGTYVQENKEYANLSLTKGLHGRQIIDVSLNYGRTFFYCNIMFVAAGRMYFGNDFKFITADVLCEVDSAEKITIGANQLIKIELFDVFNIENVDIRMRQKYFLEKTQLFEKLDYVKNRTNGFYNGLKKFGY